MKHYALDNSEVIRMKQWLNRKEVEKLAIAIFGGFLFAAGLNLFIVPVGLYSGGFVGFAQVVRTVLIEKMGLDFGTTDIAGIISFLCNIPLFLLAYFKIGKQFFAKTLICVAFQSFFLTLIQIPSTPIISDTLAACLLGGIIAGYGTGITLRAGSSGGGQDILGVFFTRKYKNFSVGKIAIIVNMIVFGLCMFLFDLSVVLYSIIFTFVCAFTTDKVHIQNINMEVLIFTKKDPTAIRNYIQNDLYRGITYWEGTGGYTEEGTKILYTVIDKYEYGNLQAKIHELDENAFVVGKEGVTVEGNFIKKV